MLTVSWSYIEPDKVLLCRVVTSHAARFIFFLFRLQILFLFLVFLLYHQTILILVTFVIKLRIGRQFQLVYLMYIIRPKP